MADNLLAPPQGYVDITAAPNASTQPSAPLAPPPGYSEIAAPQQTEVAPGAQKPPDLSQTNPVGVMKDLAIGAGKEALRTVSGVSEGVQAIPGVGPKIIPQSGLTAEETAAKPSNMIQQVGGGAEQALEFGAGEEGLQGLASLARVGKYAPEIMQMIEDYPTASKTILGLVKGATVGGAQGAVKGAGSEVGAKEGATEGAVGGGAGGAVAGAAGELLPKIAKLLGVGGQDFESAMAKAGRPAVSEHNWKKSLNTAKPIILDQIDPKSVKSIDDFVNQIHSVKDNLWETQVAPQITKWEKAPVTTTPIAQEIRNGITRSMRKHFPEEAASMEQMANNFIGNSTIGELNEDLETFNAKLQSYYKMDPAARAATGKTDGDIAGLERAADGMRDLLYKELESRGENIPAKLRQQYGALKDVERVFTKRIPVADRQQPMNLAQLLTLGGGIGEAGTALATGHPLAAAAAPLPLVAASIQKARQAPESLIRQGLKAGATEGEESTIGNLAKTATAAAGAQAAPAAASGMEQWTRVKASNGKTYRVHPEDFEEMKKRDPGLKELE